MNSPLTPIDCDLQDFQYMPLDVRRLRDSDLAALESPEACWAAVLLWSASWHQVPAASLPDDDRVLSNLAGYGRVVAEWKKVRDGALRGWVMCDDGRLYHPVVAEKANEAWLAKMQHSYGKMAERLRKLNKSRSEKGRQPVCQPTFEEWNSSGRRDPIPPENSNLPPENSNLPPENSNLQPETAPPSCGIPPENSLKGEGEGKGKGKGKGYINLNPPEDTHGISPSRAGAVCVALRADGMASVNPSHPDLIALLNDGAEIQEFVSAARLARDKGKGFSYVLGIVKGQRADAQRAADEARTKPKQGANHARHDVEEPA